MTERSAGDALGIPAALTGEMAELMRSWPWADTPFGPPEGWPEMLRSSLSICLGTRFPIAIYWGPSLALVYNDAWRPIVGSKHPWALGRVAREVWPEIWDAIGPLFEQVVTTGVGTYSEDQLLPMHRHGFTEECYFNFTFSPILGGDGRVGGVFNAVIETTERVVGERRLRTLRALGERSSLGVTVAEACAGAAATLAENPFDLPFALLYLAGDEGDPPRLAAASGVPEGAPFATAGVDPASALGAALAARADGAGEVVVVDAPEGRFGALPAGAWPEPPRELVVLPLAHAGQARHVGFLVAGANPRRPLDEGCKGFLRLVAGHIASAVAGARAFEEERRRAEALAELDRAKTAFFSNVSHEFRTPLTLLLAPLEDLRARPVVGDTERAQLDLAHRNARRLLKLVNTLLDFSRLEAGRVEASYAPTDLAALTADLASSFRSAVERAGLSLVVECEPLPEPVYVDRDMWEKVVLNLLSNAFKFTFEGGLRVRLAADGDGVLLEVADTGIGIAARDLPRLFERFHRVEGAKARSHEGSGIGLALVHELVRLHGGQVSAASELGRGTTFSVRLRRGSSHLPPERIRAARTLPPTAPGADAYVEEALRWLGTAEAPPAAPDPEGPGAAPGERARILVADDNADMREYLARLLRERWDVEAVADGRAALDAVRRAPPDLVVSDVMMPRLDGFALLRAVRDDRALRAVPVILLSARAGEEAVAEGLKAGADDYVVKPFAARDLLVRVAARLTAAKAREGERRRLLTLLAQVPAIVNFLRGPDLVFDFAHPKAVEAMGGRDVLGKPVLAAMPELREQPYYERLRRVYETGEPFAQEEAPAWHVIDGRKVETYWNSVYLPVRDAAGRIEGVMTFDLDVTASVRAREKVAEANREYERALEVLGRADRAKDEFLATMSHELRTPLNAMLGWASLLRDEAGNEAKVRRGLEVIERNARAQERLIGDLLDVSRIITGKLRLSLATVAVGDVVREAVDVVRPAAEGKGVRLAADDVVDVGDVVGDAARLQQVLWNLLANAVRFTPRGGRVAVTAERSDAAVRLRVRDTGAGIPREHLPYVFDRFRQVDSSTTRAHGGLGLGLAIVRHLVEAHGGAVDAQSDGPGRGATFTVVLPLRAVEAVAENEPARDEPAREARPPASLGHVRALVVDDEPDSLELVRAILEGAGATVTAARSAREALAVAGPFDVLVSDVGMPEMDGYALVRRLRAREGGSDLPALALTAYARAEDADLARRAGFDEHLPKPVDAERLVDAVRRWRRARRGGPGHP